MTDTSRSTGISRRQVSAGFVTGGGIAAAMYHLTRAQTTSTPEATTGSATPTTDETSFDLTDAITRTRDVIAAVQADRDAVSNDIDPATVDDLLGQATALVDDAEANATTGDASVLRLQVRGASGIARAARTVIVAQLTYPGLPSQADRAVDTLTRSHDEVATLTGLATAGTGTIDIGSVTSQAQTLYTSGYDLYGAGAFAQAMAFAAAADDLARAGLILGGQESGKDDGEGRGGMSRGEKPGRGGTWSDGESSDDSSATDATPATDDSASVTDETETPPAPDFGS